MNLARLRRPAVSALAVLLISGAGIAFAGTGGAAAPASVQGGAATTVRAAAPAAVGAVAATAEPTAEPTTEPVAPAAADTDTLQQGDQTTPDAGGAAAENEKAGAATEKAGAATEKAGAETAKAGPEEAGDQNLPGGGHADNPNDPNADHQFEGVE